MPVHARLRTCYVPKRGNSAEEYEDAFWPPRPAVHHGSILRCAVADGATETSFSGRWAQLLTRAYCAGQLERGARDATLARLQQLWRREVGSRPLPWYAAEKVRQGAFSTLLGLTISAEGWRADAIGDSCLFHIRGDALTSFPLHAAAQFGNSPHLLSSNPRANTTLESHMTCCGGDVRSGDLFLLGTDALAAWFLRAAEEGSRPWQEVRALRAGPPFVRWVTTLRDRGLIRNDDTTCLTVEILAR